MTRTLLRQPTLERVLSKKRYLHFAANTVSLGPDYTLLARNPYDRLESFFREKLRRRARGALDPDDPSRLKRAQTIFFPALGVSVADPIEAQVEALLSLDFERFVCLLPDVATLDDHLAPQTSNYSRRLLGRSWLLPFDHVVRIEDPETMGRLADDFQLDLATRFNATPGESIDWSPAAREIVNDVYRRDFERLGYEPVPTG